MRCYLIHALDKDGSRLRFMVNANSASEARDVARRDLVVKPAVVIAAVMWHSL